MVQLHLVDRDPVKDMVRNHDGRKPKAMYRSACGGQSSPLPTPRQLALILLKGDRGFLILGTPMRISAYDQSYIDLPHKERQKIQVLLNGTLQRDVITADEEAGEIVVYVRDAKGNLDFDRIAGEVKRATIKGVVSVVFS